MATTEELQERVAALEKALDKLFPGWDTGSCPPGCAASCCEMYEMREA